MDPTKNKASGDPCGHQSCTEVVYDDSEAVSCDFCKCWYHISCCEVDKVSYEFLTNTSFHIYWKCANCPDFDKIMEQRDVGEKVTGLEKIMENRLEKIETNISKKINLAYKANQSAAPSKVGSVTANVISANPPDDTVQSADQANSSSSASNIPAVEPTSEENNDRASATEICSHYKLGKCRHGASGNKVVDNQKCKYAHPKKCRKYCNFGIYGCDGCELFHPVMCKNSVRYRECFSENCTLNHLRGTERRKRITHEIDVPTQSYYGAAYHQGRNSNNTWSRYKVVAPQNTRGYHQHGNQNHTDTGGQRGNSMFQQNPFPPIQGSQEDKINEISNAVNHQTHQMHQMQSCMSYLMQHVSSKSPDQQIGNTEQYPPHTYKGYYENRYDDTNQRRAFANNQIHHEEAKNFRMHPGFTQ